MACGCKHKGQANCLDRLYGKRPLNGLVISRSAFAGGDPDTIAKVLQVLKPQQTYGMSIDDVRKKISLIPVSTAEFQEAVRTGKIVLK